MPLSLHSVCCMHASGACELLAVRHFAECYCGAYRTMPFTVGKTFAEHQNDQQS